VAFFLGGKPPNAVPEWSPHASKRPKKKKKNKSRRSSAGATRPRCFLAHRLTPHARRLVRTGEGQGQEARARAQVKGNTNQVVAAALSSVGQPHTGSNLQRRAPNEPSLSRQRPFPAHNLEFMTCCSTHGHCCKSFLGSGRRSGSVEAPHPWPFSRQSPPTHFSRSFFFSLQSQPSKRRKDADYYSSSRVAEYDPARRSVKFWLPTHHANL
jgi:hypothetical protein